MAELTRHDLELLNELAQASDKSRDILTTRLLTVYGAVSSGLFFLVTSADFVSKAFKAEKIFFLLTASTSIMIVLLSLLEKSFTYFANVDITEAHIASIKAGTTGMGNPLYPHKIVSVFLTGIPRLVTLIILLNTFSAGTYIWLRFT